MNVSALRQDIIDELDFEPSIDGAHIGVAVNQAVVTLTGHVSTYAQKATIENVVHRVKSVKAVTEEIEVRQFSDKRTAELLRRYAEVEAKTIKVNVFDGRVILEGRVHAWSERSAAERAAWSAPGVSSVVDRITIS